MSAKRSFSLPAGPSRRRCLRPVAFCPALVLLASLFWASMVIGQEKKAAEEEEIPAPEDLVFKTADGVTLAATYYPGTEGKNTVPVVLLHMFKGNRNDYSRLAPFLQSEGHAVLVPDLRGHGDSTTKKGSTVPLSAASLSRVEFMNMVRFDMPRLKQFLIERNNAAELNIEKLCVVGAEMGASVGLCWTKFDWDLPPKGNRKQGQDVKGLVVVSPEWNTPGLPLGKAMTGRALRTMVWDPQLKKVFKNPDEINFRLPVEIDWRKEVSVMIVVGGGNSRAVRDAKRLQTMLKPYHREPSPAQKTPRDLFYGSLDTLLQGTKMLGVRGLNLERHVARFIEIRLVNRSLSWAERKDPYAE